MTDAANHEEALSRLKRLVERHLSQDVRGDFAEPVDWKRLGLDDYLDIIENPMDLGTILSKLKSNGYETAEACAKDIKLVWENCMNYNKKSSRLWELAKRFRGRFSDAWREIRFDCGVGQSSIRNELPLKRQRGRRSNEKQLVTKKSKISDHSDSDADDEAEFERNCRKNRRRARLASTLLKLSGTHLCKIIEMLYSECPAAIEHHSTPGKLGILVEEISPKAFETVYEYANQHATASLFASPESKRRQRTHDSVRRLGRPRESSLRDIFQVDAKTDRVVNTFRTITAAAEACGISHSAISCILRGNYSAGDSCRGWTFRYALRQNNDDSDSEDEELEEETLNEESGEPFRSSESPWPQARQYGKPHHVKVAKCDPRSGKVLGIYDSMTAAAEANGFERKRLSRRFSTGDPLDWNGLVFRRFEPGLSSSLESSFDTTDPPCDSRRRRKSDVRVVKSDRKTGKTGEVYPSMTAAAAAVGCTRQHVRRVLDGELSDWKGVVWKHYESNDEVAEDSSSTSVSSALGSSEAKEDSVVEKASASIEDTTLSCRPPAGIGKSVGRRRFPPKPVAECDAKTGEIRRLFPSMSSAARAVGSSTIMVSQVVSGRSGPWNGLIWRIATEEDKS